MVPIYDEVIRQDLKRTVEFGLRDTLQGRIVDGSGKNAPNSTDENLPFASQQGLWNAYKEENVLDERKKEEQKTEHGEKRMEDKRQIRS